MNATTTPHRPARVVINAVHAKSGGGMTYLRNMVPLLAADSRLELHLFLLEDQVEAFQPVDPRARIHRFPAIAGILRPVVWEQAAMACATPIACSNTAAMSEIVTDAALFFDPYAPDAIATACVRVIDAPDLRADLAAKGPARARFSPGTRPPGKRRGRCWTPPAWHNDRSASH